jgi:hypothetical protein
MRARIRIWIVVVVVLVPGALAAAAEADLRALLWPQNITDARVNLNPWGGNLGFEVEIDGDDPRVDALVALIRGAEPGKGHRCSNSGAIRFTMDDGRVIGVGLLPSHTEGSYLLRLYDGDDLVAVYRVERMELLRALADLGVPDDDPAFRE